MKLHKRFAIVQKAHIEFREAVSKIEEKHQLTFVEIVGMLADEIESHAKFALRAERHPDDPDSPAQLE